MKKTPLDVSCRLDILQNEYELIQTKIDKIGEFKFKIRGWSITVLTAALAGLISKKMDAPFWYASAIIPIIFHGLEYQQEVLSSALGNRAKKIEKVFFFMQKEGDPKRLEKQLSNALKMLESAPRIGAVMVYASLKPIDYERLLSPELNRFFYAQLAIIAVVGSLILY